MALTAIKFRRVWPPPWVDSFGGVITPYATKLSPLRCCAAANAAKLSATSKLPSLPPRCRAAATAPKLPAAAKLLSATKLLPSCHQASCWVLRFWWCGCVLCVDVWYQQWYWNINLWYYFSWRKIKYINSMIWFVTSVRQNEIHLNYIEILI